MHNFNLRERMPCYDDIDLTAYKNEAFLEFENKQLTVPITGSRGCVRKCSFCNVESLWPKYVFRSGADIVDEMEHYIDTVGIKNFKFVVCETNHPHAVVVYTLDDDLIQLGRKKWKQAFVDWKNYLENGQVNLYHSETFDVDGSYLISNIWKNIEK